MKLLTVPKYLLDVSEQAHGTFTSRVAMLVCDDVYKKYEAGEDPVQLLQHRSELFRRSTKHNNYSFPSLTKACEFLSAYKIFSDLSVEVFKGRILERDDKFFQLEMCNVPAALSCKSLTLAAVRFYIRVFLHTFDSVSKSIVINTSGYAAIEDIEYFYKFCPLNNNKTKAQQVNLYRNKVVIQSFRYQVLEPLEDAGLIHTGRSNLGQLIIKLK